jgi:hypothetical protein
MLTQILYIQSYTSINIIFWKLFEKLITAQVDKTLSF